MLLCTDCFEDVCLLKPTQTTKCFYIHMIFTTNLFSNYQGFFMKLFGLIVPQVTQTHYLCRVRVSCAHKGQ